MKRFFADIYKYRHYALYSAKASLKAEVANSYLNWLWWILDPLLYMGVYIFIGLVVYHQAERSYPVYVFLGLTLWNYFNKDVLGSVKLIRNNKGIVSKVYLPKYIMVISKMINNFVKMIISFGIVLVLMVIYRIPLTWHIVYLIPILIAITLITFGCSTIVMHFGVFVDDLYNLVQVAMRFVFYLSGIFYSLDRIDGIYGQLLKYFNPIALCIESARNILIDHKAPHFMWLYAWIVAGVVVSVLGVWLVYRHENTYVKVI